MRYTIPGYLIEEKPIFSSDHSLILRAVREADQAVVAIKILKAEYPSFEEMARFKHEYEIIRDLKLPHVVQAYSFEKNQNRDMLILEYIPFPSLAEALLYNKKLDLDVFLETAIQLTEALGLIHQKKGHS